MKLIESKVEYIPQEEGLEGIYKQVELAGRTAYHSLDKITPDSAKDFVDRMIKSKHGAALEHGTVYLIRSATDCGGDIRNLSLYHQVNNKYSDVVDKNNYLYVTTNFRVLQENNWLDDLQYLCPPTEFHEKRYTMRFTCSRAIAQELTRHRVFSYLMESQRYINYSKERHGGEITFIIPSWLNCPFDNITESELCYLANQYPQEVADRRFLTSLLESEYAYMTLLQNGCTPQQARDVLPNATKTELIMTGFASDYRHLFDLRLFGKTGAPHPDMKDLMQKAQEVMQEAGIWEDIMSKPSKFE